MSEYKNRELLTFRGLTWRYDSPRDNWTPVEKENLWGLEMPMIRRSSSKDPWYVNHVSGSTPLEALERWVTDCIRFDEREADNLRRGLYELEQSLVKLHEKSWKVRGTKKKAKKAMKRKGKKK